MGAPQLYSRDIPKRCNFLIEKLYPSVRQGIEGDHQFGGNLGTTFLLAMSMPILVLPLERILKPNNNAAMADDRNRDQELSDQIKSEFTTGRIFGNAPFADHKKWSYIKGWPRFNITDAWQHKLCEALMSNEATLTASATDANQIMGDLRNALSHGGIAYLNDEGRHIEKDAAKVLAFVSTEHPGASAKFNILTISEDDYREFLQHWSLWLNK
jgi:hypothetical protein